MPGGDLEQAFAEGRLGRRAFVRQLVESGMDMPTALARADELVPREGPAAEPPPPARAVVPERPTQATGIDIKVVQDGYLLQDGGGDVMHSLNLSAALVFELCNGANDESEIARLVQRAFGLPDPPVEETRAVIEAFVTKGLVT
ncbi:MAG: PqqD family protein [Acidimicrobiia bacterium]|nr:PqqD family protein [Acidimicrobiia bacterium]